MANWRYGVMMMIVVAVVQDPLRKLVPGSPGYLVLATLPILAAVLFGMINSRRTWWSEFRSVFPQVSSSITIFAVSCIPAAMISATYGPGSWMLTILGAISYSVLIIAVIVGFNFPQSLAGLRRLLFVYCAASTVMLSGGLIEYLDLIPGSILIGTEALGMDWIRYGSDFTVSMSAGFYRSPDVMGWHAATVVMLSLVLAMTARGARRWAWFAVCAFALVALMLCGRRKMVYMLPAFIIALAWLSFMAGRKSRMSGLIALVLVPVASVLFVGDWLGSDSALVRYYTETSVETVDQLNTHGFESLFTTFDQAGFFGSGLGVATPGSHHLDVARPRVWQESATSRIMVELGVPGFLALITLVVVMLKGAWDVVRAHQHLNSPYSGYLLGLTSFFLANVGSLVVSGQILADPFIAFFLGFSIGVVLCFGRQSILASIPTSSNVSRPAFEPQGAPMPMRRPRRDVRPGPA
jgi:hypothetical protein